MVQSKLKSRKTEGGEEHKMLRMLERIDKISILESNEVELIEKGLSKRPKRAFQTDVRIAVGEVIGRKYHSGS